MIHYSPPGRLPLSQTRLDQTPRASSASSTSQMMDFTLPLPNHPFPAPRLLAPSNSVSATPQATSNPSTPGRRTTGFSKIMRKKNKKKNNSYGNDEMENADNNNNNNNNNNNVVRTKSSKKKRGEGGRMRMREPRFCFKTMSDVDVLDDGYKWRKYGQKVVKNTQYPRSYYRCTRANCRVKKRIERLPEDPRMVITTYEGRHIHSPPNDEDNKDQDLAKISWFW